MCQRLAALAALLLLSAAAGAQSAPSPTFSAVTIPGGTIVGVTGTTPLPVTVGAAGASCDATLAAGGTAQVLCGGTTPAHGWAVYNPNAADDLWCSDSTTAVANAAGSVRVVANGGGYETPAGYIPGHALSCVGATTGDKMTVRQW